MNNFQINCVLSNCKYTKNLNYLVCAKDQLPNTIETKPAIIIMNNQDSNQEGQHWISIFIPEYGPCCYFDSLGRKPLYYSTKLHLLMLKMYEFYNCNEFSYQAINSTSCGKFCLYFVISMAKGLSMNYILQRLNYSDKYVNEPLINNFYRRVKKDCNFM